MPSMDSTPEWNVVMAAALVAMAPPIAIVLLLQRWFVRGLVEIDRPGRDREVAARGAAKVGSGGGLEAWCDA
jgi:hypothetical protein